MQKPNIALAVCPWGRGDIARVNAIIEKAELYEKALAEYMQEASIDEMGDLSRLDPVALTYLFILNHASALERRLDFKGASLEDYLQVAGNYLDTSFYFNSEDQEWISDRLKAIKARTGDAAMEWLMGEIG